MRSLHLAVEVGRARFDINMPDPFVFDMPVKLCLEFVAPIGTDGVYSKWEFFDHIIDKRYGILLIMELVDLQRSYPCSVINGRVLKATDFTTASGL
jgi:hypothetical protein